jgi:hypothetical protein
VSSSRIILPVSALKSESSRVFAALKDGRTVYVSKHGDIVAAFRPFLDVPASVAASVAMTYVLPGQVAVEVTAREMGRAVPSRAVSEAAAGLPFLVTKNHDIYGVLAAASVPAPTLISDLAVASARSDAMLRYLDDHPGASLDEIVTFRSALDGQFAGGQPAPVEDYEGPDGGQGAGSILASELTDDLARWTERGSPFERILGSLLSNIAREVGQPGEIAFGVGQSLLDARLHEWSESWRGRLLTALAPTGGTEERPSTALWIREGALLADSDPVRARRLYVRALIGGPTLSGGAMWKLGDLARGEGYQAEAKVWYGMALNWELDVDAETSDRSPA